MNVEAKNSSFPEPPFGLGLSPDTGPSFFIIHQLKEVKVSFNAVQVALWHFPGTDD